MSQAGARGPGSPPKAPAPAAAKSPAAPPVAPAAPRGVAPARGSPPAPPVAAKTTQIIGVQAPKVQPAPAPAQPPAPPATDDMWDAEPEGEATQTQAPLAPVVAAPPQAVLSPVDLRIIVREMIDQAIAPLQMRIAELERRPRAPSAPAYVMQAAPAQAAPVAAATPIAAAVQAAAEPYASAMAAPAAHAPVVAAAPRSLVVAPPPLLDVKAIERDGTIDIDITGFDGGRRKRRMIILFVFALLLVFGGLFALLADSYTPHH